jgi:SPX domain protein involved in polyphosphate accumulation
MKFGRSLEKAIYGPWKEYYLDYGKLKTLLREDDLIDGNPWTDEDEQRFVDELVNVQLEKINAFQGDKYKDLTERTSKCETKLEGLVSEQDKADYDKDEEKEILNNVLGELDSIREEITRLEKFSRINYTGALKAAKKHDRRRGANYRVRPLLQVRLASLPFNSEDYSPLLYRLSAMYSFVRQRLSGNPDITVSEAEEKTKAGKYTSHKCMAPSSPQAMLINPSLCTPRQSSRIEDINSTTSSSSSIYA